MNLSKGDNYKNIASEKYVSFYWLYVFMFRSVGHMSHVFNFIQLMSSSLSFYCQLEEIVPAQVISFGTKSLSLSLFEIPYSSF